MAQHRVTHYEDADFKVEGEIIKGQYFIHVTFEKYSHNIQKKVDKVFLNMINAAKESGFPKVFYGVPDHPSFARYMGWEHFGFLEDNGTKEIFKWDIQI